MGMILNIFKRNPKLVLTIVGVVILLFAGVGLFSNLKFFLKLGVFLLVMGGVIIGYWKATGKI